MKVPRCQGINTSDMRAGQQCRNAVAKGVRYCHAHRGRVVRIVPEDMGLSEVEVCVAFDNDEPTVIFDPGDQAVGSFSLELAPPFNEGNGFTFTDESTGKSFRLYARKRVKV